MNIFSNYLKELYKQYKANNKKGLSFNDWYILTGLLDKEISYFEAELNDTKDDKKIYAETPEEKAEYNEKIKEIRKTINELKRVCKHLNY